MAYQHTWAHEKENILNLKEKIISYSGIINSEIIEKEKFAQAEILVEYIKTNKALIKASGKILLYLPLQSNFNYGDKIIVNGNPSLVSPPLNPYQFDYKKYLSYKQVYHQHFIKRNQVTTLEKGYGNPLIALAIESRKYLGEKLFALNKQSQEFAIASGIVLGTKNKIDDELKTAYAGAGAMHVLAVSGMQVALLYLLLTFVLKPVKNISSPEWNNVLRWAHTAGVLAAPPA